MAPTSLDPNADTLVRVVQRGPVTFKQTEFKVLAAAISVCRYWEAFIRHMNGTSGFKPNNTHVEDTGITIVAVEIVLRGLHQAYHHRQSNSGSPNEGDENSVEGQVTNNESVTVSDGGAAPPLGAMDVDVYFPQELVKADIDDVWGVLALVNLEIVDKSHKGKFDLDRKVVESWFLKWRETSFATFNTQTDFEKVLFPTFAFEDSKGFRLATKWLCQRTSVGNIAEYSPMVHSQGTQCDKCACWVVAHYNYLKALEEAGVLCPELDHKKTIMELVKRMKTVEYEEPLNACMKCSKANITSHLGEAIGSEEFNTASRSVKPGLIAAGIVSSWTWSSTLLTSSTFAYSYGIGGPMWYAAMGSSQILLFSLIAIKIKTNAPGAHTFPEIILAHHGRLNHLTYLFFAFATNLLVGSCLVLGGSQVVGALSGVNVYGACFLIPLVVAAYVIAGGLRSTFIADYAHTVILFVAILTFGFSMYATSPTVGSIGKFYDLLLEAGKDMPIPGNAHNGSYLTFKSDDGLVFAIDLLVAGFCTVWLDQAYWQRAIASRPETSVKAYLFGGIAWYGIPFGFATAMGLGCAALTSSPSFPTYPNPLSAAQNGSGLSAPAAAIALLGSGGAGLLLLLLFMAVTSATSAELIAVSSLITFDLYKTYIKPTASSDELVRMSHYGIIIFSVILASFCCILNAVSINLTWVLTVLGVIVGGASIPVGLILLWEPMSSVAALISPWVGTALGLVAWFVVTKLRSGSISVETTGDVTNAVAGNVTSCCTGVIMAFVLSYLSPSKWGSAEANGDLLAKIRLDKILQGIPTNSAPDAAVVDKNAGSDLEKAVKGPIVPEEANSNQPASDPAPETVVPTGNAIVDFLEASYSQPMDAQEARKATRLAYGFNIAYWTVAMILVPFAFFGTEWEFTRAGFVGWCVVSFIWVWFSALICIMWPMWESRETMWAIVKGIFRDARGTEKA
ncbi:urea permease [Diaporthe eres]|uniref:Urea permease n=1 Tax=Diaporthe eres TaxID=83184 RepID=A0ABR1P8L4_DIAER